MFFREYFRDVQKSISCAPKQPDQAPLSVLSVICFDKSLVIDMLPVDCDKLARLRELPDNTFSPVQKGVL